jgi:hypothetical protein
MSGMDTSNLMRRGNAFKCRDGLENPIGIEAPKAFRSDPKSRVHPYSTEPEHAMTPKPDPSPVQTHPAGEYPTPI